MALFRQPHDGGTKPMVWTGEPVPNNKGHIEEVSLMLEDPDGNPIRAKGSADGEVFTVGGGGASGPSTSNASNITRVAAATSATPILAAGTRKSFTLYNDSDKRVTVALKNTVSAVIFTFKMNPDSYYEDNEPFWQGDVYALWDGPSPSGAMQITELT